MKYSDDLFNLSKEYCNRVESNISSEKIVALEISILNILIDRYKKMLSVLDKNYDGILKIRLRSVDDGYLEVEELINMGKFSSFGSDYSIYVSKVHDGAYIDLIWDYKRYFEELNNLNLSNLDYSQKDNIEFMKSVVQFKKLPLSHRISVIKSFNRKVKKQKLLFEKENIGKICKSKGHDFTEWKPDYIRIMERNPYLGSRDYIVPEGMEWIAKTYPQWERKCKRCGLVEGVTEEPEDVREKRLESERQFQIEKLERELRMLRGK